MRSLACLASSSLLYNLCPCDIVWRLLRIIYVTLARRQSANYLPATLFFSLRFKFRLMLNVRHIRVRIHTLASFSITLSFQPLAFFIQKVKSQGHR